MVFFIEGNIGSGKSTLTGLLKKYLNIDGLQIEYEPVQEWKETRTFD